MDRMGELPPKALLELELRHSHLPTLVAIGPQDPRRLLLPRAGCEHRTPAGQGPPISPQASNIASITLKAPTLLFVDHFSHRKTTRYFAREIFQTNALLKKQLEMNKIVSNGFSV